MYTTTPPNCKLLQYVHDHTTTLYPTTISTTHHHYTVYHYNMYTTTPLHCTPLQYVHPKLLHHYTTLYTSIAHPIPDQRVLTKKAAGPPGYYWALPTPSTPIYWTATFALFYLKSLQLLCDPSVKEGCLHSTIISVLVVRKDLGREEIGRGTDRSKQQEQIHNFRRLITLYLSLTHSVERTIFLGFVLSLFSVVKKCWSIWNSKFAITIFILTRTKVCPLYSRYSCSIMHDFRRLHSQTRGSLLSPVSSAMIYLCTELHCSAV